MCDRNDADRHNLEELADAFLRYHSQKRDEDKWAFGDLDEMVRDEPQKALEVTLLLLKKAGDDDAVLAYVAAGPLENLLKLHGGDVLDRIERESKNNSRLQLALSGVDVICPPFLYQSQ